MVSYLFNVGFEVVLTDNNPNSPDDKTVPASLSYHLSDIYLEELDKVLDTTDYVSPRLTPPTSCLTI